jgi:predicted permease
VLQDVRYALRRIRRAPGFSLVVTLTLALGIGLNTAVFSGVHALLLRPLPGVEEPERLVQVYRTWPGTLEYGSSSIPHYRDLRDRGGDVFDGVAAWAFVTLALGLEGQGEIGVGQAVSANFFEVLGVEAALGRTFRPEEADEPGAHPVVVLGHTTWRERFGGDPDVIGRTVEVNGAPFEVVGVAPEGFKGATALHAPLLWAPLAMQARLQPGRGDRLANRDSNFLGVIARMKPGASLESTRAGAVALLEGLREEHPETYVGTGIRVLAQGEAGVHPSYGASQGRLAAVLMAVVGMLLLLACANVASMLLARTEQRRREVGIRLGLGAGRARIVRQLLIESLVLAVLAGAGGLALAYAAVRVLDGIRPLTDLPFEVGLGLGTPVLLFTLAIALGTTLLFGLVPALHATRPSRPSLRVAGAAEMGRSRLASSLVVVQTAIAAVLLLSAAVFLRSLRAAVLIDPGFRTEHLLSARVDPGLLGYDRATTEAFLRSVAERMESRPDVRSVSWTDALPLGTSHGVGRIAVPGYHAAPAERLVVDFARIGPGYFASMGIPVLRGREFSAADDPDASDVVVVNQAMATRYWPGRDPLGTVVETQGRDRTVVGIVGNGKYRSLGEASTPFLYLPLAQDFRSAVSLVVRARGGDPAALAPVLRATLHDVDPAVVARDVQTMESHLGLSLLPARLAAAALGLFGALGLLLATLGIYGVIAHTVSRRTREIGIRIALGADPGHVQGTVVGRGARLAALGLGVGLLAALAASEAVRGLLYTGRAVDPVAFVGVPFVLGVVALVASWIPARAAARIDPARTLKAE